jgi:hypothetical protein
MEFVELLKNVTLEGIKQYGDDFREIIMVKSKETDEWSIMVSFGATVKDKKYYTLTNDKLKLSEY